MGHMKVKNMPAKSQTLRLLAVDPATLLGGAELFMLDFLRFLSRKRTISCTLATSGISDYIDQVPKPITVKMIEMPRLTKTWRSFLDVRAARNRLVDLIRKNKIEIILSNSIRAHLIATLAARKTRVPIVWMIHDFTFPRWLLRWLIKTPVQIMCVSESVRTYIVHATNSKWAGKITVVPNGVDLKRIDQLRAASGKQDQLRGYDAALPARRRGQLSRARIGSRAPTTRRAGSCPRSSAPRSPTSSSPISRPTISLSASASAQAWSWSRVIPPVTW